MSKISNYFAVQWTNKSRADPTNQTARSLTACSPFLPNLTTYLPPSLRFLHYLAVCLLRLGLFWQVIMKMFWVIETKARSSQSNNGTAAVATTTTMRMTTTTVAFLSSAQLSSARRAVVGVAWAPISTNTLKCCPLNRWKNVNISYALWRCRQLESTERKERRGDDSGKGEGRKRNDCWSKYLSSFSSLNEQSYAGSHFLSHFHFYHQSLRFNTCPTQQPTTFGPRHLMKL